MALERQILSWGHIDWLTRDANAQGLSLDAGIVTIAPHAHMEPHVHYNEQVLYMLQGTGHSYVDGKKLDMPEGTIYHWQPGVIHEMVNTGDIPFRHLMVTSPAGLDMDRLLHSGGGEGLQKASREALQSLYAAVEGVRTQFLDTMRYSCGIFDAEGNLVARSRFFPQFCKSRCGESLLANAAPCMYLRAVTPDGLQRRFKCPYGLTAYTVPIVFRKMFLGYVEGGFIHTEAPADEDGDLEGVYDVPQSAIEGVQRLLERVAKAIENFCEFDMFQNEIMARDLALADNLHYQELLAADLKNAASAVTDLKLNNHFLFNTLNQMASMALDGGQLPLYQSILDLSKMFRYSLRNQGSMVTLDREYEYLSAYLKLQKLRYGDKLTVDCDADGHLEQWLVPFNFLMPVVENAFLHGFSQLEDKRLSLSLHAGEHGLEFLIANNGAVLDPAACRAVMLGMHSDTAHGLSMVYSKLRAAYGEEFSLTLQSDAEQGTRFHIRLPARRAGEAGP